MKSLVRVKWDSFIIRVYREDNPYFADTSDSFVLYAKVYKCLQALGDARALQMINEAHILLRKQAEQFADLLQEEANLALPEHQNILHLYAG